MSGTLAVDVQAMQLDDLAAVDDDGYDSDASLREFLRTHPRVQMALEGATVPALERELQDLKDQTGALRSRLSSLELQIAEMHEQSSRLSRILAERGFAASYSDVDDEDEQEDEPDDVDAGAPECDERVLSAEEIEHVHRLRNLITAERAERETLLKTYHANEHELDRLERENEVLLRQVQMSGEAYGQ